MKIEVDTLKECPENCRFLRVSQDISWADDHPIMMYVCENQNICENLINNLREQNKLKEDD